MKKNVKVIFSLIMTLCLVFVHIDAKATNSLNEFQELPNDQIDIKSASNKSITLYSDNPTLTACELGIGINKNGIGISFSTTASDVASEIGCRDMVLQEKTLFGWRDIPVKDHCDFDTDVYFGAVVYLSAEIDKTYRVYCTHYAIIDDVEYTLYNITENIVYN